MKEKRINWIGMINILLSAVVSGVLCFQLPNFINKANGLAYGYLYGIIASYFICCLIFFLLTLRSSLIIKRESYFVQYINFMKRVNSKLNKRSKK